MSSSFETRTLVNAGMLRQFAGQSVSIMLRLENDNSGSNLTALSTDQQKVRVVLPEPLSARKGNWVEIIGTPAGSDAIRAKEVWMDWKINIRKKLAHNKAENISTGGGPFNKYPISSIEDAVARLSGIYVVIESDPNTMDFGVEDENNEISHAFQTQNETSTTQTQSEPSIEPSTTENLRRKRSQPSTNDNINKYMFDQTTQIAHISGYMKEILEQSKNIVKTSKFIESDLRKLHKSVESLNDTLKETKEENMRHNLVMEKCRLEELSLKKRKIEIEEMKLSIERSSK